MRDLLQRVAAEAGTPTGLPLHDVCRIAKGVMLGAASMHGVSAVVHMDLKPDNAGFMRAGDLGSVVIMDYGIAQQAGAPLLECRLFAAFFPAISHLADAFPTPHKIGLMQHAQLYTGRPPCMCPEATIQPCLNTVEDCLSEQMC